MPGRLVWSWYKLQADRGMWENQYAVMSDAAMFIFESLSAAARLGKPWLIIHSDFGGLAYPGIGEASWTGSWSGCSLPEHAIDVLAQAGSSRAATIPLWRRA